jgi:CRP/FNR family cyclic AMP-dependent transcriptional regulator
MPRSNVAATVCHVLREDEDLAAAIPLADRDRAIEECIAAAVLLRQGRWGAHQTDIVPGGIGLLVLDGMLIRNVRVTRGSGAELLGEGDLLRPWQGEQVTTPLPHATGWQVLRPARLAVLDSGVARRFARYPELTGRLVERALERSRNLAINMAIVQQPRVHIRVHMLLWHLANRWGYAAAEGIVLPLHLTHEVLADLVAARRPTVSTALAHLGKSELVRPGRDAWLLSGPPPGEMLDLQDTLGAGRESLVRAARRRE